METVWKYDLSLTSSPQEIKMPKNAEILTSFIQHSKIRIWAKVINDMDLKTRTFLVIGTGQPIKNRYNIKKYISTFPEADGNYIWHLFEIEGEKK